MERKTPLDKWISDKTGISPLTREALREYQLCKLREIVEYTKTRGRFYRERLRGFGGISSFTDFEKLPFTKPDDISQNSRDFLCVPLDDISRIVTLNTSGSTGKSKRVFFTEEDQELTVDFFRHGMSTFTVPGDRVLIFMPGQSPGGVCGLLARGVNRLGAISLIYGAISDYKDAAQTILKFRPDAFVGIPAQMYRLARETAGDFCLKSVLLASDYIPPAFVGAIRDAWSCEVFTHYGMTETGLGGAVSCHAHAGYHMRDSDLYFEIIDAASGRGLPDGEYGEIVVTTLNHRGMPLIRYRTGDMSRILSQRCPCGGIVRRFDHIADRGVVKRLNVPG